MTAPRVAADYDERQVQAAHRVLVDVAQVLGSFRQSIVVVGGWVPDLLLPHAEETHIGSIDVDLALDAKQLTKGRYAEILKLLLETGRYEPGEQAFQMATTVDLKDGGPAIRVDVDFLAPKEIKLKATKPKSIENFRVLQADGCDAAFRDPEVIEIDGPMISGATNRVTVRVAAIPDFVLMKCFALQNRDKPKDAYDIVYCLEHFRDAGPMIAAAWRDEQLRKLVRDATKILREKFSDVRSFGPQQVVEFHNARSVEERDRHARNAFERVQQFLALLS